MKNTVNENEAPAGFYAVEKPTYDKVGMNICTMCDWRPQCNDGDTDFENPNHKCMSYTTISRVTGNEIKRKDGCSVIFKRRVNENT